MLLNLVTKQQAEITQKKGSAITEKLCNGLCTVTFNSKNNALNLKTLRSLDNQATKWGGSPGLLKVTGNGVVQQTTQLPTCTTCHGNWNHSEI